MNHAFFVIELHGTSRFREYMDPKMGGHGQLGDNVSDESCWEAGDYNVAHVCGHHPTSICQCNLEWTRGFLFIVDRRAIHDKKLGGA